MTGSLEVSLSVIIPAYNEEQNLGPTLQDIRSYFKDKDYTYEIIVVDDGSKDKTAQIALSHKDSFPSFTLLKNSPNRGKGFAVKQGIFSAKGETVLFMDADNSTRINEVEKLLAALKKGSDIAIASRKIPGAIIENRQPPLRIVLGKIYILLSRVILGTRVKDYNCGFKLFKAGVARALFERLSQTGWGFDSELIYLASRLGFALSEVPVTWTNKRKTSKVRPVRDGLATFFSLISIRLNSYKKSVS